MTRKAYRRLLLAAITLLMMVSLVYTGSGSRAAAQDVCQECMDNCGVIFQSCTDQGYPFAVCSAAARRCSTDCLNNECQTR